MVKNNMFSGKDSMDITELASLNDDISPELIEQLQQKISLDALKFGGGLEENDDSALFEEPQEVAEDSISTSVEKVDIPNVNVEVEEKTLQNPELQTSDETINPPIVEETAISVQEVVLSEPEKKDEPTAVAPIGKISEKLITPEQKNYNDSLDFLDGNVKYSKYVIYIDPQNVDFIEGLTVKERKNLINKILREQDDIAITKGRFKIIQTIIKHAIVAILTIAISIPVIYLTINASLEASINNYRRSQTNFQVLYKEKGKITNKN